MSNSVFTFIKTNPFGLNDNDALSTPTFADIDRDEDQDAFVGDGFGGLYFYRNTGTISNPAFADIDNDGDMDAFIGTKAGTTNFLLMIVLRRFLPAVWVRIP
ncbi:MAG: VCBS repeat-containing protein [Nitrosomonas sp.]|nr:VCBS repeat-containing protein [Nitrosomonas sp.]